MKILRLGLLAGVLVLIGAAAFIYLGIFAPGADEPHSALVHRILQVSRDRAIAVRADDLKVPNLSDAAVIRQGAGNYAVMCSGCHLAPGMPATELSKGLYPAPPALASALDLDPAEAFWVIKHGIKMSAMPAWGKSMGDSYIWGLVAFLKAMPVMTPAEYRERVATSGGHSHGGGETMVHDEAVPHHHDQESPVDHAPDGMSVAPTNLPIRNAAEATVRAFQEAVQDGNRKLALRLLAPDVKILEGGETQSSRDEYAAHHLQSDMDFLKASRVIPQTRTSRINGNTATVSSTTRIIGNSDGKPLDMISSETATLEKTAEGWRIVKIVWSSAAPQ
jgi:mono/diheme cytochrome c family protein/ketosteroid isomerase-like protein